MLPSPEKGREWSWTESAQIEFMGRNINKEIGIPHSSQENVA